MPRNLCHFQTVSQDLPGAGVAELVDALDLGSSDASRGGSSPFTRMPINTEAASKGRFGAKKQRKAGF